MRGLLMVVALCAACSDNLVAVGAPLAPSHDLFVVAHQRRPPVHATGSARGGAERPGRDDGVCHGGNGTKGLAAAEIRYEGLKQAYAEAAGDDR